MSVAWSQAAECFPAVTCSGSFGAMSGRQSSPVRTARAPPGSSDAPRVVDIALAYAAIYFIWGSTYLAIRFAIETLPPLLMAAARFIVAGALLYAWTWARGAPRPTAAQWRAASVVGGLLLVGGNGAVVVAQQWVPSGLAALLVGTVPLWMVVVDLGWGGRRAPTVRTGAGILVGFGGVALLAGSPGAGAGGARELLGAALVVAGALSWAVGSIYSRHAPMPPAPRRWVAMQMLCGGALLVLAGLATGELAGVDLGGVSLKSTLALAYLIILGSVVAYAAYIWLLSVQPPARVATYAYVNPVVALLLGWALAGEPVTPRTLVAAAVIVGAVVVVQAGPGGRTGGERVRR